MQLMKKLKQQLSLQMLIHLLSIYLMDMILLLQAMVKDYLKDKDNYLQLQEQQLLIHQF